jgi:hypothetical protein
MSDNEDLKNIEEINYIEKPRKAKKPLTPSQIINLQKGRDARQAMKKKRLELNAPKIIEEPPEQVKEQVIEQAPEQVIKKKTKKKQVIVIDDDSDSDSDSDGGASQIIIKRNNKKKKQPIQQIIQEPEPIQETVYRMRRI